MKDFTEFVMGGAAEADIRHLLDTATPYTAPAHTLTNGVKPGPKTEAKNGIAAARPARKSIGERTVDLADVAAPLDLPLLLGRYLLKGAAHWLTGQTGIGKSTLLFNIACALAEGTSLWGIECEQTRILYCDMESGDVGRAYKVERLYRDRPRIRGQLLFLREPVKLPEELLELLAFVEEKRISLVIFDTARRVFCVRDENDNAEVYSRIVPTLDALKQAGIASLTMGHPAKNGNGSARGAGAQEDAGDVNLSLTMHGGEIGDPNGVIALRVTKNRLLGLGIPPLLLRRVGDDQFERVGPEESGNATEAVRLTPCAEAIQMYLASRAGQPARHGEIVKAMITAEFPEGTAKRTITQLQQGGIISHDLTGGYVLE